MVEYKSTVEEVIEGIKVLNKILELPWLTSVNLQSSSIVLDKEELFLFLYTVSKPN